MLNGSSAICKTLHLLTGFSILSFVSGEARLSVIDAVDGSSTGTWSMNVGAAEAPTIQRSYPCKRLRQSVLDIAKSAFQVHGVDAAGQVVIRRQLKRRHVLAFFQKLPHCLVGVEACASVSAAGRANSRHSVTRCV